jgi:hypothetical protein
MTSVWLCGPLAGLADLGGAADAVLDPWPMPDMPGMGEESLVEQPADPVTASTVTAAAARRTVLEW